MISRASVPFASVVALLGISSALCAQRTKPPTLDQILQQLQANLDHYDARVPSLFCNEHVLSSQVQPGQRDQNTVTDSIFRLKRTPQPAHTTALIESRDIQSVNGKPAASQRMDGPTLLSGAFEGALAVVSLNQNACMKYTLDRVNPKRSATPYIVHFATDLTPQNTANCLLQEKSKGRVFIDPTSLQITHLEINTPRHTIIHGSRYTSPMVGKRDITVDYAPVVLNGETFWMPSTISLRNTSGSGTFHEIVWSFHATYRNYHKLEVTSRIVPDTEANAP